jgi:hypothetical protein
VKTAFRIVEPGCSPADLDHALSCLDGGQAIVHPLIGGDVEHALRHGLAGVKRSREGVYIHPRVAGGALGSGAVYERNLPPPGTFSIDPVEFAVRTSRNRKPTVPIAWPGYGTAANQKIDSTGIVGTVQIMFDGTLTQGASAVTVSRQWPWNLIKNVVVSANGINNLFACDGVDLRALMRVRHAGESPGGVFLFDRESIFAIATSTANPLRLFWEIPLAFDESLVGAVFAQTEETTLNVGFSTAQSAELFTANPPTSIVGNFKMQVTFFSIPIVDSKAGRKLVIPDITQLHGVVSRDDALTGTGDHVAPLTRTGGILLRSMQRFDNSTFTATSFDVGNIDPTASITTHKFRYGGNVVPIEYTPAGHLRFINETAYADAMLPTIDAISGGTPPAYLIDDFVIDSPMRDSIHMLGITEAQLINTVATSVTVVAGARVHTVQEAMVAS